MINLKKKNYSLFLILLIFSGCIGLPGINEKNQKKKILMKT